MPGLFDYYNPDPIANQSGLFGGGFADRWAPVMQALLAGSSPSGAAAFDPNQSNNTAAYTAPFSQQQPQPYTSQPSMMAYTDQPQARPDPVAQAMQEAAPSYQPPQNYTYGGRPETNPLLAPRDPQNAPQIRPQGMPPSGPQGLAALLSGMGGGGGQSSPGIGDRLSAGFQGAGASLFGGGGPIGAIINLLGGLSSGQRTDPQGVQQAEMIRMYHSLQTDFKVPEPQARAIVMHPELAKEFYKAFMSQDIVQLPDGTIGRKGPGGGFQIIGAAPKPELVKTVDKKGTEWSQFLIPPTGISGPRIVGIGGAGGTSAGGLPVDSETIGANGIRTGLSPGAIEEQKKVADVFADTYKGYVNAGISATKRLSSLQRIAQLSPDAFEGGAAPVLQQIRSILSTFGGDAGKVPKGEEFIALSNKLVLDSMPNGSLGAQISNTDRDFIAATIPNLSQTKEGRMQLVETATRIAKREQEVAAMATKWRKANGTMEGFDSALASWAEDHPLFADKKLPDQTTPAQNQDQNKTQVNIIRWERGPDGKPRRVQ